MHYIFVASSIMQRNAWGQNTVGSKSVYIKIRKIKINYFIYFARHLLLRQGYLEEAIRVELRKEAHALALTIEKLPES